MMTWHIIMLVLASINTLGSLTEWIQKQDKWFPFETGAWTTVGILTLMNAALHYKPICTYSRPNCT